MSKAKRHPYLAKVGTNILLGLVWLLSHLPLRVLYSISTGFYYLVYYIVRYRRKLVSRQLADSFPEKSESERKQIAKRFYRFFCDYIVETLKLATMSHEEMQRRVEFVGIEEMQEVLKREGKQFGFFYLGHYCNWEWLASFPMWLNPVWQGAQIYHPLYNKQMDDFFINLRQQFGGICIPMKQTLRQILTARKEEKQLIIGFIADQAPKWEAMHHWTSFLNHQTSFFIGTEKIARQVDAALYYIHVTRPRRGYYRAEFELISMHPAELAEFEATDRYAALLEQQIKEHPELWLWTHHRWKRSHEEWLKRASSSETSA
ncbi:MAG: lysophospholipid acyltransferase family protein [Bacteroidaceae bacterium]|nr:lysophospholipid acyltransferase family protein [Bacteroidaceae bacterium]